MKFYFLTHFLSRYEFLQHVNTCHLQHLMGPDDKLSWLSLNFFHAHNLSLVRMINTWSRKYLLV